MMFGMFLGLERFVKDLVSIGKFVCELFITRLPKPWEGIKTNQKEYFEVCLESCTCLCARACVVWVCECVRACVWLFRIKAENTFIKSEKFNIEKNVQAETLT